MTIERKRLASTAISFVEYDTETQDMSITFSNGQTYDLTGVPPDAYAGLVSADSPGKYFNQYLKGLY